MHFCGFEKKCGATTTPERDVGSSSGINQDRGENARSDRALRRRMGVTCGLSDDNWVCDHTEMLVMNKHDYSSMTTRDRGGKEKKNAEQPCRVSINESHYWARSS